MNKDFDLDIWFDPMIVFDRVITLDKTCEQQWKAFSFVHNDTEISNHDVSEYLGASYMASLALNLDASLRIDYD